MAQTERLGTKTKQDIGVAQTERLGTKTKQDIGVAQTERLGTKIRFEIGVAKTERLGTKTKQEIGVAQTERLGTKTRRKLELNDSPEIPGGRTSNTHGLPTPHLFLAAWEEETESRKVDVHHAGRNSQIARQRGACP